MIVFLLLVIIAILLVGSSRFIGAVGALLGAGAGILAVFFGVVWLAGVLNVDSGDLLMYLCGGVLVIAVLAGLAGVGQKPQ